MSAEQHHKDSNSNTDGTSRDESVPPPGWERYQFRDEDGVSHEAVNVRRRARRVPLDEAWALYDSEHGYAPAANPLNASREVVESLGDVGRWVLHQHAECHLLGDPELNRGYWPGSLRFSISEVIGGVITADVTLSVYDSSGRKTASYGPSRISATDLPALRTAAMEWAHGFIASIARDLGLIPQPFAKKQGT